MNKEHTKEQFDKFMSQLKETNATLDFFCDFDKIKQNVDAISMKLHQLNYLLGKEDIREAIGKLWDANPKVFDVLDILVAIRKSDKKQVLTGTGETRFVESYFESKDGVVEFVEKTGLGRIFKNGEITNLVDYVFGVETGLDTNARKNRSGTQMENTIAAIFDAADVKYRKEVCSSEFPELGVLGEDNKRFDFVIETDCTTYLLEVNFYSGNGSKLNEVARAYSELSPKINAVEGFKFVWITDGKGWNSARNKLEEAFYAIPQIYNLTTLNDFIQTIKEK